MFGKISTILTIKDFVMITRAAQTHQVGRMFEAHALLQSFYTQHSDG